MRLAAISVDLDSLPHYCRIHGLPESLLDDRARGLVYKTAVPRFRELFQSASVPATFFAIGEDLESEENRAAMASAHQSGVEIANHSYSHDYALSRKSVSEISADVRKGAALIERATGQRPKGFRAPGYTLSSAMYRALLEEGVAWDSSVFPAVPYYAAKAMVMGALAAVGRPSKSVLDTPRVLLAPTVPYHPDPEAPYSRGGGAALELPVTVSPGLRLPFIGTFAVMMPNAVVKATYGTLKGVELFNFELHGVDVLSASDGIPDELVRVQRDLRIPVERKLERLGEIFTWLRRDFDAVTLTQAAERFAGGVP
ncbi:MAG: polysaccharide deacetylase family protein [Myxococcaceae bacterium]